MRKIIKQTKRGFTLVELMIVVAIVGVLAALAIYGVSRYVANAKTTEARGAVARIAKDATTAYARPKMEGTVMAVGAEPTSNVLCKTAASVPTALSSVKASKYQSAAADWTGDASTGWTCLMFSMSDPQAYQYSYTATTTGFSAIANGDLDGDDDPSTFQMDGAIQADQDNALFVSPSIKETDPLE